jgi:hypothetical protein
MLYARNARFRSLVTAGSSCRSDPDAQFRGFAKSFSPFSIRIAFTDLNAVRLIITSPRISIRGMYASVGMHFGILDISYAVRVTSSHSTPLPLVIACVYLPYTYTTASHSPSYFGCT